MRSHSPCLRLLILVCLSLLVLSGGLRAEDAAKESKAAKPSCVSCHNKGAAKERMAAHFDVASLGKSVHSTLECTDCHEGLDASKLPHAEKPRKTDCAACHEKLGETHAFHPRLGQSKMPEGKDTHCVSCHGTHGILGRKNAAQPFSAGNMAQSCGLCHEKARDDFLASAHARMVGGKGASAPTCLSCHKQPITPQAAKRVTAEMKLAQARLCESCHSGREEVYGKTAHGAKFVAGFDKSVHGAALARGEAGSATCVDCHGSHEMNRAMLNASKVSPMQIMDTCMRCHAKAAESFAMSVHAEALKKGNSEAPTCTRCHGEHDIKPRTDPESPANARNLSQAICAGCHASLRLTKRYGLASDRFQTFSDSFHGLAVRGGSVEVVNCASCHESHAILSHRDPRSSVSKDRLADTCGRCHPGANTRYATGSVHVSPDQPAQEPLLRWVANFYLLLIFSVVGAMLFHNLLDFVRKVRRKLAIQKGLIVEEKVAHRLYLRMSVNERLQHACLVLSFMLLVVTGFMLRYPESWWVQAIRGVSDHAFSLRGLAHRVAGVALLAAGVWHLAYLLFTVRGKALLRALLPRKADLVDPWRVLAYNLGLRKDKPKFDRFSYVEKAEYWALIWGSLIMGATGAVLWFDNLSMGLITKLGFDVARSVHYYEAILASLSIIVWHIYWVVFNPDFYPMNLSWLTGRMSEREMHEEHPLELERLKEEEEKRSKRASREV